jgi:PTS system mannose-specific IID component
VSLSLATQARVFWRCLFIQAAWNRRGMQNLGFAFAIDPALRRIYPDPAAREEALQRHLGVFNCHPFMAAAIMGGAIHHEERVAAGEEPGAAPAQYKAALQGPLAALGDGFFWTALRPFVGAAAVVGALTVGWLPVVLALLLYNGISLALRWHLFQAGYRLGDGVVGAIARLSLPRQADRLRFAATALCGVAAGLLLLMAWRTGQPGHGSAASVAAGAGVSWLALSRGVPLLPLAYAAMAVAVVAAAALGGHWMGGT